MFLSFPFICQDKWNGKDRLGSVSHLCFRERRMSWDSRSTVSLEISGSGLCFLSVVHVKSEDNWQSKAPSSVCFEMTFFSMPVDAKGVFILKQAGSFNEASRTFLWLNPYGFLLTQWVGMIDSTPPPQFPVTYTHTFYCSLLFNVIYHVTCLQISWRCPWEKTVLTHKPGCHLLHRRHLKLWLNACTSPTLHILVISGFIFLSDL